VKFLLATHHLSNWSGSELVTLELAEELTARGHAVDIFAAHQRDGFTAQWKTDAINFTSEFSQVAPFGTYDLVYTHHGMLARLLLDQPEEAIFGDRRPVFVYNHLSPVERFERPGALSEILTADVVLANSPETAAALRAFGPNLAFAEVMPNPAPQSFESARRKRHAGALRRLLVVSNHLPPEVLQALDILIELGIEVRRIGLPESPRRLVPDDLHDADAVLTIGKTVQYAFRAGCPVYIYDQFAGPGWLKAANAEKAEKANFSGRDSQKRKSPAQIAREIGNVPKSAIEMVATCPQRFQLEHWVDRFVRLAAQPRTPRSFSPEIYLLANQLFRCERNAFALVDELYDYADRYREAYQTCSAYADNVNSEIARLRELHESGKARSEMHLACDAEAQRSAAMLQDVERFRTAYETESARSAILLSDAERFHKAYEDESARSSSLLQEIDRLGSEVQAQTQLAIGRQQDLDHLVELLDAERDRTKSLVKQISDLKQALDSETASKAALEGRLHEFSERGVVAAIRRIVKPNRR